jgi:NAD(P)H-hydrate epimerase
MIDISNTPQPLLPARRPDSHKGDYGRGLLIGGSRGMSGAIALAGRAALRSGAGLVTLAVPQVAQAVVAGFEASYMTRAVADDGDHIAPSAAEAVLELAGEATVVALGPGLGRSAGVVEFSARLYRDVAATMVVDADALFALAERPEVLAGAGGPRVLTPHPGEFARLTGRAYDAAKRVESAAELAASSGAVVVLKGHRTVVTDGSRYSENSTGNPGMATGGSGDVLTGVVTGLLCQGLSPFDAARLGVHVHGLAGDLAAEELGQVSLMASDLADFLPGAFRRLKGHRQ